MRRLQLCRFETVVLDSGTDHLTATLNCPGVNQVDSATLNCPGVNQIHTATLNCPGVNYVQIREIRVDEACLRLPTGPIALPALARGGQG